MAMQSESYQSDPAEDTPATFTTDSFHPLFSSNEGDVILGAKGGGFFRVHSYTLKTTSAWFRTMFSLPQSAPATGEVLYVDEDAWTLECLLRMVCGLPLAPIASYDLVDALLFAAEKYDMPGPLTLLRVLVMTPPLLGQPFRLYAAACRFGWDAEAKIASTQTLSCNLYAPEQIALLKKLPTSAVLNLFELHRKRREGLRQRLDQSPFVAGGFTTCVSCNALIDYHTWRELKYKIILEMDVRPLGDTVLEPGLSEWAEARACWAAKCSCNRVLYDKAETLRVIRECIDGLPKTI